MALVLFVIQVFIGFYSRKIFLDKLGTEVIGINTTLGNILSFLNLAELGIGIAMATSLYKPIQCKDKKTICEIISVQGWLYRRIAIILCVLSVPILILLPYIFPDTGCSLLYIYVTYLVFLFGSISSYLWNYKEVLIGADQKNYKLMPWIHGIRYAKVILQIIFLKCIDGGIWGWIGLEFIASIITIFIINHVIYKEYPWLKIIKNDSALLVKKYHDIIVKTKQLFVHKIGSFVLEQTAPLIIYAFVSLSMVAYYGNYMIVIGYAATLINVLFEGMGASIGNLVAENRKEHTLEVFWELFSARIFIAAVSCFAIYVLMEPFIRIWIGEKYILSDTTLFLMIMGVFIRMTRQVIDSFKNAYQLFADVWAPVVEAILNLGLSIFLGYLWGLNGILLGANISLIIIVLIWKPYYTFTKGFKMSPFKYYVKYILHIVAILVGAVLVLYVKKLLFSTEDLLKEIIGCIISLSVYFVLLYFVFLLCTDGMKHFNRRIINVLKR